MKESKKIDNLNEDFDKETEKQFNEELNEIKEKLNSEKLSDEFKSNLQAKLQEELNKDDSDKGKIIKFPTITRKLAGICACFVFLFSSCFVFADDIENVILELFGNTDRIIAKAIEDGNYREIKMDYVEDQGISIKVDYVVIEDDELYIAFNVLGEKFDKIFFNDICLNTNNNFLLHKTNSVGKYSKLIFNKNYVCDNNTIIVYKLSEIEFDLKQLTDLKIEISNVAYIKNDKNENIKGRWNLEINI